MSLNENQDQKATKISAGGGNDVGKPSSRPSFDITLDERRILVQGSQEATRKRAVPAFIIVSNVAYAGSNYLLNKMNPRPVTDRKVVFMGSLMAGVVAYAMVKTVYIQTVVLERIAQLPENSEYMDNLLGKFRHRHHQMQSGSSGTVSASRDVSFSDKTSNDNDAQRERETVSYEELRAKNRAQYTGGLLSRLFHTIPVSTTGTHHDSEGQKTYDQLRAEHRAKQHSYSSETADEPKTNYLKSSRKRHESQIADFAPNSVDSRNLGDNDMTRRSNKNDSYGFTNEDTKPGSSDGRIATNKYGDTDFI